MAARHIPCGDAVNESERIAIERLRSKLPDGWVLLSNVAHSLKATYLSDEIDLIAIGPSGVTVIEVKHWDQDFLRKQSVRAESEAERINEKAKRVASKIRERVDAGFVRPAFFLTQPGTGIVNGKRLQCRGVPVFGLTEWKDLVCVDGAVQLVPPNIELLARLIEPACKVAVSGELRRFGELINLEKIESPNAPFQRIYRGQHPCSRDRVVLHLFDLSASQDKNALELARRGFEAVRRWQKSPYVPSLLDSFQEAEHYPGELFYFTLADSDAPSLKVRVRDAKWSVDERVRFARESLLALKSFHAPEERELEPLLHRNITPETLRVKHNQRPLFTAFEVSRLTGAETISASSIRPGSDWIAPEVRAGGLAVADARSDVYSLCKTLITLFDGEGQQAKDARDWLALGCADLPEKRETLASIAECLERNTKPASKDDVPQLPAPDFWDEDTVVLFRQSRYRVVSRLGRGGIGQTFKVVEVSDSGTEFGTYVAKLIVNEDDAKRALVAYRRARQHTTHPHLSALHEIAAEWQADRFAALLKWVDGTPLSDHVGIVALRAEDLGETDLEALLSRWARSLCEALWQFHEVGLVHGDVSPRNIIECNGQLVLTDYDTVSESGTALPTHNPLYCSARVQQGGPATPSDDLFALAASLFQVIFDREPFLFGAERTKARGLNWHGLESAAFSRLKDFLDRATHSDPERRFGNAREALEALKSPKLIPEAAPVLPASEGPTSPQIAPRLRSLLSAYPGSRHGNAETRGLDSDFAVETYVETGLDRSLRGEIESGETDLVILFGNAGDGKTAFLQNLADNLVKDRPPSQQRLWECRLSNGRPFKLNLDGSAAYQGQGANALLEDFLRPFHTSGPKNFTRALAINSGKMLEWLEQRDEETLFTAALRASLFSDGVEAPPPPPRVRLVDLNRRSLVGGYKGEAGKTETNFLDSLLNRFLEGSGADPWSNCSQCSAQTRCTARASVVALRDPAQAPLIRSRLADALQAAHLRGEIHITARELRAALAYIFFGLHDCGELHEDPELKPAPFWDRAFAADGAAAEGRQGDLLAELARLDPALDADPILDRALLQALPLDQRDTSRALQSARRRAYFTWTEEQLRRLHLPASTLALHGAEHLDRFRRVPEMSDMERAQLCRDLCEGIARLEDLPTLAFRLSGLPLRVTPRTPTESCFWVLKPHERFHLHAPLPHAAPGLEVLHTHLLLAYQHPDGRKERLPIGLELFHLLLSLKDGAQLMGATQEGAFAHLDLFVQRITQEDVRELYGWHPEQQGAVARLRLELRDGVQTLTHEPAALEAEA